MSDGAPWQILGMGLAGSCLAWQLEARGVDFCWCDDEREGAASRVAAGLMNPVTGKNFEPSWQIATFMPEAMEFFAAVEAAAGETFWHPLPVVRLVTEANWKKVSKKLERPDVAAWVEHVEEDVEGWRAAVTLKGGGRFDARGFCEATRKRFAARRLPKLEPRASNLIRCDGFVGLMDGVLGEHRCAKGEILTVEIPDGDASRILVGVGGWLVPVGDGLFKAGATYDWDELDGEPTEAGRERVEEILDRLGVGSFQVVNHEAGVRPIVRRSKPLIGPLDDGTIVFNGLGSKGSLYAPGVAARLADWLAEGEPIDSELEARVFLANGGSSA